MGKLSKLQTRAKVLSVISQIKSAEKQGEKEISEYIEELNSIEDKKTLLEIYIKEYIKTEEEEKLSIESYILKEIISVEDLEDAAMEIIKSEIYSDEIKYKLVMLMRYAGVTRDFNELPEYFKNPESMLDNETKKLLETATFNPESMLDFLDFISAVSPEDRKVLITSLGNDYRGDELANILYPILYSDFEENVLTDIIKILAESKSSLAISPINYLIKTSDNPEIISACKLALKKLKLAGCDEEKALEYFKKIIQETTPAEFYTTIPDGAGNQALLISRKNEKNKYMLMATVINDRTGISDTFGFYDITYEELTKITTRFYQTEGKYRVKPEYVKYRINKAEEKTIKSKRKFPYEYICWKPMLSDIELLNKPVKEINKERNPQNKYEKDDIAEILTKDYTFRWYLTPENHKTVKIITDKFYDSDCSDITPVNNLIKESINEIFNEETKAIWEDRLNNLVYLLNEEEKAQDADKFLYLTNDSELIYMFYCIIIQRSITNYTFALIEKSKQPFEAINIFKKKESAKEKYEIKKLNKMVKLIKEKWINE